MGSALPRFIALAVAALGVAFAGSAAADIRKGELFGYQIGQYVDLSKYPATSVNVERPSPQDRANRTAHGIEITTTQGVFPDVLKGGTLTLLVSHYSHILQAITLQRDFGDKPKAFNVASTYVSLLKPDLKPTEVYKDITDPGGAVVRFQALLASRDLAGPAKIILFVGTNYEKGGAFVMLNAGKGHAADVFNREADRWERENPDESYLKGIK